MHDPKRIHALDDAIALLDRRHSVFFLPEICQKIDFILGGYELKVIRDALQIVTQHPKHALSFLESLKIHIADPSGTSLAGWITVQAALICSGSLDW